MNIAKYFWDLTDDAVKETKKILKDQKHPKFVIRMVTLLSRCDKPKELFSIITEADFIEWWPQIRSYWVKRMRQSDFRDWWETIYERLLEKYQHKTRTVKGKPPAFLVKVGVMIKEARIKKGLSQKQLALNVGMKQPDISTIEEGKKNITLHTLARFCRILDIKKIDISE